MKNLHLQVANMILPKKTADGTNKTNGILNKSPTVELSNTFQMMLNRQVKNQKDSAQKGAYLQEAAQKSSSLQNNTELKIVDEKAKLKVSNDELVAIAAIEKQASSIRKVAKNSHETSESENAGFADVLGAKLTKQTVSIAKVLTSVEEVIDSKSEEAVNSSAELSSTGLTLSFAQAISTPVMNAIVLETTQETLPALTSKNIMQSTIAKDVALTSVIAQSQDTQAEEGQASDIKVLENDVLANEFNKYPRQATIQQSVANQVITRIAVESELSTKLALNTTKDSVIKELAITASYQPAAQINSLATIQQVLPSNNIIQAYPGKSGWDQAISQKVVWMVGASEQSATLTLNPPDLGPLQVVISVKNDMVDTAFMSDNVEVRQALQDGMTNLREKLSESGIQLGQANVSAGGQSKQEFQQATQNRLAHQQDSNASLLAEEKTVTTNTKVSLMNGLVDTFA